MAEGTSRWENMWWHNIVKARFDPGDHPSLDTVLRHRWPERQRTEQPTTDQQMQPGNAAPAAVEPPAAGGAAVLNNAAHLRYP